VTIRRSLAFFIALLVCGCTAAERAESVSGQPDAPGRMRLACTNGIDAQLVEAGSLRDGQPVDLVRFSKKGNERRFLAVGVRAAGQAVGARTLKLTYRVDMTEGSPPPIGALVFEEGGGVYYKVHLAPVATGELVEDVIPISSVRQASFSRDVDGDMDWCALEKLWIGLIMDGPAAGDFELSRVEFSTDSYKPPRPLEITGKTAGNWSVGKDPAVSAKLTLPDERPGGGQCMKVEFRFPGMRHMYLVPSVRMPAAELEGYGALRLTYKAKLPEGIEGLLVSLNEVGGAQYYADPPPPPSAEWKTVDIPFSRFVLGGWSRDANGQLDVGSVERVVVGVHGKASGTGGTGAIWVTDIQFIP